MRINDSRIKHFTRLVAFIMAFCGGVSTAFHASYGQELYAPYAPTRAVVPTLAQLPTLGQAAYTMGLCHDSIRWYKRTKPFNKPLAQFGIARCQERLGQYEQAFKTLANLHTQKTLFQKQVNTLRGHVLLMLAEEAQLKMDIKKSEGYLRTFVTEHRNQREHGRYGYLMRQQATLKTHTSPQQEGLMPKKPLRVGVLLPLSGKMAPIGQGMEHAALMALFNQSQKHIELYPEDTQGTPQGAIAAFERAVNSGIDVALGPVLSDNVKAITPFASSAGIPVLAYSSDKSAAVAKKDIRLFSILPTQQARLMAQYAVEQKGLRVFSALVPNTPYGHTMLHAFKQELSRLGATFDRQAFFDPNTPDLNTPIRHLARIAEAEAELKKERDKLEKVFDLLASAMDDADLNRLEDLRKAEAQPLVKYQGLFVPAPAHAMPLISSQLAFYDSDGTQLQLLGTAQWHSEALTTQAQSYLRYGLYPTQPQQGLKAFADGFQNIFKTQPHPLGALAYDSVNLIAHLAKQGFEKGHDLDKHLQQLGTYHGVTGPYQLRNDGTLRHGYSIMQLRYKRGKLTPKEVDPAPFLLPSEAQVLKVSNRSHTFKEPEEPRTIKQPRRFFGGLFGH